MRFLIVLYFTVVASVGAVNVWTEDGNEKGAEGSSIRRYLPECEAVAHSSARTCDATGAAGITGVTCNTGAYETGTAGKDLGCTVCIDQTNCAVSTANTCSTTSTFTTKTICTSVTANGFYLDGQVVKTCATSGNGVRAATVTCTNGNDQIATSCNPGSYLATNACPLCEAVAASSARTCNAGGAAGITGVTCNTGAYETGAAGKDLGCTVCIDQTNCAVSTANTCSTTSTFTTKTICTSVTANGFYLDGQVVKTCATSGNGVRAATVTCTNGNDQIATSCNPGSYLATNACPLCEAVAASSARTCNAGGAAGITGVTCINGASHQIGTSGVDLGCTLCAGGSFYDGSSCGQCPKGYWLGATSVTTPCKACLAGLYNDQLSQDEVTDCVRSKLKN